MAMDVISVLLATSPGVRVTTVNPTRPPGAEPQGTLQVAASGGDRPH